MKSSHLIISILLFLGGGLAGWLLAPSESTTDSISPSVTKSSRTIAPRSSRQGQFGAQLQIIRDTEDQAQRLRLTINLARAIPTDQIQTWLDQGLFSRREGFAIVLFSRVLEQRLMTEDPERYLARQLQNRNYISEEDMLNFTGENLDLYLNQLRTLSDAGAQVSALQNLAKVRGDLALLELEKINLDQLMQTGDVGSILRRIAKSDLSVLKAKLDDLPFGLRRYGREAVYR
ncbi:MAG: hypothetical protein ACJAVK_001224, partial [Akkermansiaceae bacterium]